MIKNKKAVSLILILFFLFVSISVYAVESTNLKHFSDLEGHWGEKYVEYLVGKGVISGYSDGTFRPNDTISRAEAVKMLVSLVGPDLDPNGYVKIEPIEFPIEKRLIEKSLYKALEKEKERNLGLDKNGRPVYQEFQEHGNVNGLINRNILWGTGDEDKYALEGHWSDRYMLEAIKRGYVLWGVEIYDDYDVNSASYTEKEYLKSEMTHYNKELLFIDKPILRGELARLVVRALDIDYPEGYNTLSSYIKDFDQISAIYRNYVLSAVECGLMTTYKDGTFKANKSVTRVEACKVFCKFLKLLPESAPTKLSTENNELNRYVTRAKALKKLLKAQGSNTKDLAIDTAPWYTDFIYEAEKKGYFTNINSGFPEYNITRLELAILIVNALDEEYSQNIEDYIAEIIRDPSTSNILQYIRDYNGISDTQKEYVLRIFFKGIMCTKPDKTFRPNDFVTEEELLDILGRFLEPEKRVLPKIQFETVTINKIGEFIEPEFSIVYPENIHIYNYFYIQVDNASDYSNAEEYYFTVDNISHPETKYINLRDYSKPNTWGNEIIRNNKFDSPASTKDKPYKSENGDIIYYHRGIFHGHEKYIYNSGTLRGWKPSVSNTNFKIKDGDALRYKITVSNSKESKKYYIDIEFRNKYFNICK